MNILKRSLLYIVRKRKRTLLLLIILTVISTLVLSGLSILNTTKDSSAKLRESTGSGFSITPNLETATKKATKDANSFDYEQEQINNDMLNKILKVNGVKGYNSKYIAVPSIQALDGKNLETVVYTDIFDMPILKYGAMGYGCIDTNYDSYFTSNKFKLAKGRHITKDDKNKIIMSSELAKKHNFKIGDKLKWTILDEAVEAQNGKGSTDIGTADIEVEIVGIFDILTEQSDKSSLSQHELYENFIFSDMQTIYDFYANSPQVKEEMDKGFYEVDFFVKDPKELETVMKNVKNISSINWNNFTITANDEVYKTSSDSMSNVDKLITTMIVIVVIISLIIVTLILSMWTRSRLRETGILMSTGISKANILTQYTLETLFVALFAFGLCYFISSLIAGNFGNIIDSSIESSDIKVTINSFIPVFSFGILSILISIGVSSISIMRMNPKEILSKMS